MPRSHVLFGIVVLFVASQGSILSWNLFSPGKLLESSTTLKDYANGRLSALRNLRDKLRDSTERPQNVTAGNATLTALKSRSEDALGSVFKNINMISSLAGPLKKMISSQKGVETLTSLMMPKRELLKKLLDIKDHLEPNLKRYLTDKYNWFLTSLVPYSENIGVPPFVLNSMKIPQDLDPRWQFIKTLLESQMGLDNFLKSVMSGAAFGKLPEVIESRSGDETELISDQDPDASKGYRMKQQQYYLQSFKKRLAKPGSKIKFNQAVSRPSAPSSVADYDSVMDQQGQYGHVAYDVRAPEEMYSDAYYTTGNEEVVDMSMSASGHGGRGHGHGGGYGGHGGGASSYGGFLDPFTILGGLAFLTYLGLLLQNSLNRNMTGRSFPSDTRIPVIPFNLYDTAEKSLRAGQKRHGRSLQPPLKTLTLDHVVDDMSGVWRELEELRTKQMSPECLQYKHCRLAVKLKQFNLEPLFSSVLLSTADKDRPFVEHLLSLSKTSVTAKVCESSFAGMKKCRTSERKTKLSYT